VVFVAQETLSQSCRLFTPIEWLTPSIKHLDIVS